MSSDNIDVAKIAESISEQGFCIIKNLFSIEEFEIVRNFWIDFYQKSKVVNSKVLWDPYLGHVNFTGFTSNHFNHVYRTYDFKWNEPLHHPTRALLDNLEVVRKKVIDYITGGTAKEIPYYYSSSHYPPNNLGFMKAHIDGVSTGLPLLHILVPITFLGVDYFSGGQFLLDRAGNKIASDAIMVKGDAIIYDGSLVHGVEKINNAIDENIGRIQIFSIPNHFTTPDMNEEFLRNIPLMPLTKAKYTLLKSRFFSVVKNTPFFRS